MSPRVPMCSHFIAASGKAMPSQGAMPQPTSAHSSLAPPDLLDHGGIVALAFAALNAGFEHGRVECGERHLLPARFRLLQDEPEILQRLMNETLRRIFAAHHFRAFDVHHLAIGGGLPCAIEKRFWIEPKPLGKHEALGKHESIEAEHMIHCELGASAVTRR